MEGKISKSDNQERVASLDFLRIIATFAVIMLHVAAQNWYATDVHTFEWNVFNFYDSMVRWSVPVFVMISGSLFLGTSRSIKELYRKYIFRILTALLFWSFFYALVDLSFGLSFKAAVRNFLTGHYHLWFLFMIIGLYVLIPIVSHIVSDTRVTRYFLILAFVFAFVLPQVTAIASFFSSSLTTVMQEIVNKANVHMVIGYTAYFIAGYVILRSDYTKNHQSKILILGVLGFLVTIVSSAIISRSQGVANSTFYGYFTINVLFESILIFSVCANSGKLAQVSDKTKQIIRLLSSCSFGAYLIHDFIMTILDRLLGLNTLSFNPLASVPIISLLIFAISFAIAYLIRRIPVIGAYIS